MGVALPDIQLAVAVVKEVQVTQMMGRKQSLKLLEMLMGGNQSLKLRARRLHSLLLEVLAGQDWKRKKERTTRDRPQATRRTGIRLGQA